MGKRIELSCGHVVPASPQVVADLKARSQVRCPRCNRLVVTAEQVAAMVAARNMEQRRENIVLGPVQGPAMPTAPDGPLPASEAAAGTVVHVEVMYGSPTAGACSVAPLVAACQQEAR